jgi:aquaporin related protein
MLPHRHNSHGSRESRKELIRGPAQARRSFIEPMLDPLDPMTPMNPADIVGYQPPNNTAGRRQHRYSDNNPYANRDLSYEDRGAVSFDDIYYRKRYDQRASRHTSRRPTTPHRAPYPEDNYSEDEEEARAYRRRPHRQHRRPPASYDRYGPMPGRNSLDAHQTARDELLARGYSLYYDSDLEATSRRPRVYVSDSEAGFHGGGGGGGRRPPSHTEAVMRLPWTMWMNSSAKNHFVAFIGEFVGTTMFLFFAFAGTQVANIGAGATSDQTTTGAATGFSPTVLLYIAVVFGFSLMVNVWIFFRISGGLFNPAVTFAMLLCRAVSPVRATLLLVAQLAGSIFSSFLVSVMFPTSFNVRTTLSPDTSIVRGVFIEAVLTAELVFTIFMLAKEKHKGTPFLPPLKPRKKHPN